MKYNVDIVFKHGGYIKTVTCDCNSESEVKNYIKENYPNYVIDKITKSSNFTERLRKCFSRDNFDEYISSLSGIESNCFYDAIDQLNSYATEFYWKLTDEDKGIPDDFVDYLNEEYHIFDSPYIDLDSSKDRDKLQDYIKNHPYEVVRSLFNKYGDKIIAFLIKSTDRVPVGKFISLIKKYL